MGNKLPVATEPLNELRRWAAQHVATAERFGTAADLLRTHLQMAVPLAIEELRWAEPEDLEDAGQRALAQMNPHCDGSQDRMADMLFGSGPPGSAARAINGLVVCLAVGAYLPGGVTAFGMHWCINHTACIRSWAQVQHG